MRKSTPRLRFVATLTLLTFAVLLLSAWGHDHHAFWSQWGRDPQHSGRVYVDGQPLNRKLADIVYDPFTAQEKAENEAIFGEAVLSAHYMSTLIDGNSFYMIQKSGHYVNCNPQGQWEFAPTAAPMRGTR
jgi:hypothetical protein